MLDIHIFLQQFALLLGSGISILMSLELLEKLANKPALRLMLYQVRQELLLGKCISHALQQYPQYFDHVICQLILVGENSGELDNMLNESATYLKNKLMWHSKIKKILAYPLLLCVFTTILSLCLLIFIVPRFAKLFSEAHSQLPWVTQVVFNIANFLTTQGLYLLYFIIIILIIGSYFYFHKKNIFLHFMYTSLSFLSFSILNQYWQRILFIRWSKQLATLLKAGINLADALATLNTLLPDRILQQEFYSVYVQIQAGTTFHQALQVVKYFPDTLRQFIELGEQAGTLDSMLKNAAQLLEMQVIAQINTLLVFLEPLIMIGLGVLIGGVIIAMYLPIFQLGNII